MKSTIEDRFVGCEPVNQFDMRWRARLRIIAGEHYPLTILGIPHTTVCRSFSPPKEHEEVAPEDLGWIDIILNGQI